MRIVEGDRLKDTFTRQLYKVKGIINGTVILEAEDMLDMVWLDEESLELFYEMGKKRGK
ncbi:MAG: hypothetical protein ABII96_04285 [Candidatus Zixiibacteriota bacterium]